MFINLRFQIVIKHNLHIANCTPPFLRVWVSKHPQVHMQTRPPISTNVCFISGFGGPRSFLESTPKQHQPRFSGIVTIAQYSPSNSTETRKKSSIGSGYIRMTNANALKHPALRVVWHPNGAPFWQSPTWSPKLAS